MQFYHGVLFTDYAIGAPARHQRTLGAYAIASLLRKRGLQIKVVDFTFSWTHEEIELICKKTISSKTKFIGLSSTFLSKDINLFKNSIVQPTDQFSHIVKFSKKISESIRVVQGGGWSYSPHPLAEKIFSGQNIESEILKYFEELIPEMLKLPFLIQNEIPEFTSDDMVISNETLPIETARGCIFNCKFCGFTLRGKKKNDYVRSSDTIAQSILSMQNNFQTENFYIAEDTFNESLEKLQSLHLSFQKAKLNSNFVCYARLDLIYRYPEMIDLLYNLGVRAIMFGIETFNKKAGLTIGKGLNPELSKSLLLQIREKYPDLYLGSGFIIGLPGEDLESVASTNSWLSRTGALDHWHFQPLYLDTQSTNPFKSEFSKNAENYGYEINQKFGWKLDRLTFHDCFEASEILNQNNEATEKSRAYPWAIFAALQYESLGNLTRMTNSAIYETIKNRKFLDYKKLWKLDEIKNENSYPHDNTIF